jgi:capsule polysaccharide export protein KpsE/RkpR
MRDGLVDLMLERWKTVAVFAALGTAAGVTYALAAPEWYEARLTVVPAERSRDLGATLGIVAKLPGMEPTGTDSQRIEAVLTSASVTDEVIERFDLEQHYGTDHREHARGAVWSHCATNVDRRSGVVALTCEDEDPHLARAMAAYFGEVGNRVFERISTSAAREEARFLETQVAKARHDVDLASRKLREFQEQHKIIDLPEQTKSVISAMASIKGDLLSKQLEVTYLSGFSARTESSVVQLQQQIAVLEAKLAQLERSRPAPPAAGSASFFPEAMTVPELRYELEQLLRDQKIDETVFLLLTQRYETARSEAARDTSTFQILDNPTLPTYRSRPKRRQVAAFGLAAGVAFAAGWIVVPVWWRRRRAPDQGAREDVEREHDGDVDRDVVG